MKPGRYVALIMTDTGSGMSPEVRARIFEPFFTTKERGKGTGLGLATVYGIVKQNEGYIFCESAVGEGTTFRIYLPRVDAEPDRRPGPEAVPESVSGTETVLLVEDEPMVRGLVEEILVGAGYRVLTAGLPEHALEIAAVYDAPDPSPSDRRHHAAEERPGHRRRPGPPPSGHEGALHVRLYR